MAAMSSSSAGGDGGNGGFGGRKPDDLFERTKKDRQVNPPSTTSDDSSESEDEESILQQPKREQRIKWTPENDHKLLLLSIGRDIRPKEFERIAADYPGKADAHSSQSVHAHADSDARRSQPRSPFRSGLGSFVAREIRSGRSSVSPRQSYASVGS